MKTLLHAGILSLILTTFVLGNASDLRGTVSYSPETEPEWMRGVYLQQQWDRAAGGTTGGGAPWTEGGWQSKGGAYPTGIDYTGEAPAGGEQPWVGQPEVGAYPGIDYTEGAPLGGEQPWVGQPEVGTYPGIDYTEGAPLGGEQPWVGQPEVGAYPTGIDYTGTPTGEYPGADAYMTGENTYEEMPTGEYPEVEGASEQPAPQGWAEDNYDGHEAAPTDTTEDFAAPIDFSSENGDTGENSLGTNSGTPPSDEGEVKPTQGVLQAVGDAITSTFEAVNNVVTSVADRVFGWFGW